MELVASEAEVRAAIAAAGDRADADYLVWVAALANTTQQTLRVAGGAASFLPHELALSPQNSSLALRGVPGGVAMAHVTLFAAGAPINGVSVDFPPSGVGALPQTSFSCLQTGPAVAYDGSAISAVDLPPATWSVKRLSRDGALSLRVDGRMEFDGHLDMAFVIATTNSSVASTVAPGQVSLRLAVEQQVARFANGGGYGDNGGFFPRRNASALDWIWTTGSASPRGVPKLGTGWRLWLGDVDAGLWLKLKGASRDWNRAGGGELPVESWARDAARGGLRVASNTSTAGSGGVTTVEAYAQLGAAALASAGTAGVTFNFSLMATPVKGDWQHTAQGRHEHYVDARHYHVPYGQWEPPDPAALRAEMGINVYILHQSNRLNPYIDYPFHPSVEPSLAALVRSASQHGVRTKLYYTVGQLSNHAIELFALASLNGEILLRNASDTPPGPGPASAATATQRGQLRGMGGDLMGNEWLEEHLVEGYQGGWFTMNPGGDEDASIADDTTSRILNYYIEGQQYLFSKVGIAGLYYDGFGAERFVQQRIRRMTTAAGAAKPNTSAAAVFDVHGRAFQNTELLPH
eukprot:g25.t1